MTESTEMFVPFPAEKRQQLENLPPKQREVVNPHHPHFKNRQAPSPAGVQKAPIPRAAAANISVTGPGLSMPAPSMPAPSMPAPHAAPVYQQQVEQQGFDVPVTPNSRVEAASFALPSNFFYYGFKEAYIKTFKGAHFSKLHRAREEESLLHIVEAVSSVLEIPGIPSGAAFYLTLPDFYATLYWLRLHSFLKHGFTHQTMCRSKKHHDWVANGRPDEQNPKIMHPVLEDTLKHAETITKASLRTKVLEAPLDLSTYVLDHPGIRLVPATMQEILEITMNDNLDRFNARIAASIQPVGETWPLAQRMQLIDDLSADDIATIRRFENDVSDYGVEESIVWQCKTCGHKHTDQIQLEAHSFFPLAA